VYLYAVYYFSIYFLFLLEQHAELTVWLPLSTRSCYCLGLSVGLLSGLVWKKLRMNLHWIFTMPQNKNS